MPDQGQVMTARTLPKGWKWFQSAADSMTESHWYATAPYDVEAVRKLSGFNDDAPMSEQISHPAWNLDRTVSAQSWNALRLEVGEQIKLYQKLISGGKA
ncbi:hypothetical protein BIV24_13740 [Streptomyces colonosanans]|uniref:Uncharacterized protein n=2 Tax=Streptomyces colonosanans TaxID=1428652 RepID=A0A1S2PFU8_9ACTN|nr:hypothetical protein BIV24_13740 [Streptomyces colonosanans]